MSKQARVATDPELLKPIIEAVIFASEEPISARSLIRLLAGEKDVEPAVDDASASDETLAVEAAGPAVADAAVDPAIAEIGTDRIETAVDEVAAGSADEEVRGEIRKEDLEVPEIGEMHAGLGEAEEGSNGDELGAPGHDALVEHEEEIEGDSSDLADAMERVGERVSAGSLRPSDGSLDQAYLRALIDELNDEYLQTGRAFRIVEVAGGFQFATVREYGEFVAMLSKEKARRKLSPAALETLAIIAYRQPVSKPEVESIRGVNCDQVLLNLMEKNLVAITGRSEGVGRPLLYGTTEDFLRSFGLKGLGDLPKLREIEELMEEDAYSAERAEVITVDETMDVAEMEAQIGAAGHAEERAMEEVEDDLAATPEEPVPADAEDVAGEAAADEIESARDLADEAVLAPEEIEAGETTEPETDLPMEPGDTGEEESQAPDADVTVIAEPDAMDEMTESDDEATESAPGDPNEREGEIAEDINAG